MQFTEKKITVTENSEFNYFAVKFSNKEIEKYLRAEFYLDFFRILVFRIRGRVLLC